MLWALALALATEEACSDAEACPASRSAAFWASARSKGLTLNVKRSGERVVTSDDIFYGRPVVRIPRSALLSNETVEAPFRATLAEALRSLATTYNLTDAEEVHMVSLALALVHERRLGEASRFASWLALVEGESALVLTLTEPQRAALAGSTVAGAYAVMQQRVDLVEQSAPNASFAPPLSRDEAEWAVAVILKHARTVHPPRGSDRPPRMCIIPREEVFNMPVATNPDLTLPFQEEVMMYGEHKDTEGAFVTQIARSDMVKGSALYVWPGRLSNSELILRYGRNFSQSTVGVGRNVSVPPNWRDNAPITGEYAKYNCSYDSFELRFSRKGKPATDYVRCFRVSWLMTNGWYSPLLTQKVRLLDKWPPPKKYTHSDWLSWTQADLELQKVLRGYCEFVKGELDEADESAVESLRGSDADRLVYEAIMWERDAFTNCLRLLDKIDKR